jgi:hypothetical protein
LPNVVEKDHVLGWILAGINAHEELAESWVFNAAGGKNEAPSADLRVPMRRLGKDF